MESLLNHDQSALSAALRTEEFHKQFATDPERALSSLGIRVENSGQAVELAERYFEKIAQERRYAEQLLVTACDSDFEATTGRETNASDRDC